MAASEQIEASGLPDWHIAEKVGVSGVAVHCWRRKKSRPATRYLARLAEVLECTPADLRPDLAALFAPVTNAGENADG